MLTRLALLVAAVEVAVPVAMLAGCNRLLFFPADRPRPDAALGAFAGVPATVVHVVRPDGRRLAAYDVRPAGAGDDAPVVLFLHGNAGNIAQRAGLFAWFAATARVRLLAPDYSGYGGNEGSPSEDEIGADALAAFDHLTAEGVPPGRIVVYGESIGGGPALRVATERPVAGLCVQSTFSTLSSMAWDVYPWLPLAPLLVSGRFPNTDRIARTTCPVLVVHGTDDRIVPHAQGVRLHAAAPPSAEFLSVPGADHNDLFDVGGDAYVLGLGERFRRWTK